MTNLEAVYCEVKPYCSADNQLELEKALLDAGSRQGWNWQQTARTAPKTNAVSRWQQCWCW